MISLLKLIAPLAALAVSGQSSYPAKAQSMPVVHEKRHKNFEGVTASGDKVLLELTVTEVQLDSRTKARVDRNVITVYNPQTRTFWWTHQIGDGQANAESAEVMFLKEYHMVAEGDRLLGFCAIGRTLWVRVSAEKSVSADDGNQRLLSKIQDSISSVEADPSRGFHEIVLGSVLRGSFFEGVRTRGISLAQVTRSPEGWVVVVKNERGEMRTVLLNDAFQLIGVRP